MCGFVDWEIGVTGKGAVVWSLGPLIKTVAGNIRKDKILKTFVMLGRR